MALINCPECDSQISDKAIKCVNCGINLQSDIDIGAPVKPKRNNLLWYAMAGVFVVLLILIFSSDPSKNDPEYTKNIIGEWKSNDTFYMDEADINVTSLDLTSFQSNKSYQTRMKLGFSTPEIKANFSIIESGTWKIINGELILTQQSVSSNPIDSNSQTFIEEFEGTGFVDALTGKKLETDTVKIKELTKDIFISSYTSDVNGQTLISKGKKTFEHPDDSHIGKLYLKSLNHGYFDYQGDILHNTAHGKGIGIYSSSEEYSGIYKNGMRHGKGILKNKKNTFTGNFVEDDFYAGTAIMYHNNGDKYEGEYLYNKRDGFGTYTWANGSYYIGNWKNHYRHDKGKMFNKYKQLQRSGVWNNDKYIYDLSF